MHVDEKTALDAHRDLAAQCPQFFRGSPIAGTRYSGAVRTNPVRTAFAARYRFCPSYCLHNAALPFVLRRSHPTTLQARRVPHCSGSRHVKKGSVAVADVAR
ncbi:hypothetical protein [Paraburkholderia tuberum]|uniref:hypothetical protein n=1 Tax=Paraburkholderia tuberum TaxID=157910 RepID=UPI00115FD235|nr:hypothetical protein [Paraburkholderia tuberum]